MAGAASLHPLGRQLQPTGKQNGVLPLQGVSCFSVYGHGRGVSLAIDIASRAAQRTAFILHRRSLPVSGEHDVNASTTRQPTPRRSVVALSSYLGAHHDGHLFSSTQTLAKKMSVLSTSKVSFPTIAARCDLEDLKEVPTRSLRRRWPTTICALCRTAFFRRLARLNHGRLTMLEGSSEYEFGDRQNTDLQVTVNIRNERAYRYLATGGSLGAAEAYLQNLWDCEDLVTFFRFMIRNTATLRDIDRGWSRFRFLFRAVAKLLNRNTKAVSRRNIASHYDLSNRFFELFLDETMTYSSGIFAHPQATLREASVAKYDRICRTIQLSPDDHVLEIGTGWGGFAIHAARKYGCRVTTTTISHAQHEYARRQITQYKLSDRVTLLLRDYRDLDGIFDKLVSIEMIEAVGHEFLPTYFSQ